MQNIDTVLSGISGCAFGIAIANADNRFTVAVCVFMGCTLLRMILRRAEWHR